MSEWTLEQEVRHLMWTHHGHAGIYGDDGEMQCGECAKYGCWDYRNAPLGEVRKAYQMARFEQIARIPARSAGETESLTNE